MLLEEYDRKHPCNILEELCKKLKTQSPVYEFFEILPKRGGPPGVS
jgi:hypothetical protein